MYTDPLYFGTGKELWGTGANEEVASSCQQFDNVHRQRSHSQLLGPDCELSLAGLAHWPASLAGGSLVLRFDVGFRVGQQRLIAVRPSMRQWAAALARDEAARAAAVGAARR